MFAKKPTTHDQVFLDKFLVSFTCSCVQWTSFSHNLIFLDKFCLLVCRTGQVFLDDDVRTFAWMDKVFLAGRTHRTIFFVEKVAWPAFEPRLLFNGKLQCQFMLCTRANKTCQGKICQGKLGRVYGASRFTVSIEQWGFSERVNNTCYCYSVGKITIEVLVIQFVFLSHWVRAIRAFYI